MMFPHPFFISFIFVHSSYLCCLYSIYETKTTTLYKTGNKKQQRKSELNPAILRE